MNQAPSSKDDHPSFTIPSILSSLSAEPKRLTADTLHETLVHVDRRFNLLGPLA